MSDYSTSLFSNAEGILDGAGHLVSSITGKGVPVTNVYNQTTPNDNPKDNNTILYVGIAVAVLVVFVLFKK